VEGTVREVKRRVRVVARGHQVQWPSVLDLNYLRTPF